MDMNEILTTWR